jgi:hypothetical protein
LDAIAAGKELPADGSGDANFGSDGSGSGGFYSNGVNAIAAGTALPADSAVSGVENLGADLDTAPNLGTYSAASADKAPRSVFPDSRDTDSARDARDADSRDTDSARDARDADSRDTSDARDSGAVDAAGDADVADAGVPHAREQTLFAELDREDDNTGDVGVLSARERALLAELDRDAAMLLDEERAARRPSREVELPRALSASQVVLLRADPAALARELARPLPRRPVPQARRGTRFHAWVEEIFQARPLLDPDDLPGAADAEFDDGDLAELQAAFLAGPYGARRPFAVEEPFELALAGRVLRGRIDAVYDLGEGRWDVVDWKTGRSGDAVQLAVYRLAWARRRGVDPADVGAAFLHVRTGEVARPPLMSEADLVALLGGPG